LKKRSTIIQFCGAQGLMLLAIIQGVVLVPLYLRYIGSIQYGQWLALGSIVAMLGMIDFGVTSLATQRTAFFHGRSDMESIGALIGTIILFDLIIAVCIVVSGFVSSFWLPQYIGAAGEQAKVLQLALRFAAIDVALMLLVNMSGALLFGIQKPAAHMGGMLIATAVSIALTVIFLFQNWGILAIACGSLERPIIALTINIFALVRNFRPILNRSMVKFDLAITKSFFRAAVWLGPSKIGEAMTSQLDNLVVIKLLSPLDVTILNLTRKAAEMATQVVSRISASLMSGLAHLNGSGDTIKIRSTIGILFLISGYAASWIMCIVLILNDTFVNLWVSSSMYAGASVTVLTCIYGIFKMIRLTTYNVVFAHGDVRITSISSMTEVATQLILGILLCRYWGIVGVVAASIIAVTVGGLIQLLALLRMYRFGVTGVMSGALRIAGASSITLVIAYSMRTWHMPYSWLELMYFAAGMTMLFSALLFFLESGFRRTIIKRLAS
jgi:O-antigen/teichoic acid export membrane protein